MTDTQENPNPKGYPEWKWSALRNRPGRDDEENVIGGTFYARDKDAALVAASYAAAEASHGSSGDEAVGNFRGLQIVDVAEQAALAEAAAIAAEKARAEGEAHAAKDE